MPRWFLDVPYIDICVKADLLVHDAQYTEREYRSKKTWGCSTYGQAMLLASSARAKRIGFFHHDPERTDEELDVQVDRRIECFAESEGMEIVL